MAILNVPVMYLTIQDAVDNASSNDIIVVNKGIYHEAVVISNSNIIVMAADKDVVLEGNSGNLPAAFILNSCSNVEIRGFNIRNYGVNGISESSGFNNRFIKNIIVNSGLQGILISSYLNLILDNKIVNSGSNGIEENNNIFISISNSIIRNYLDKSGGHGILKSFSVSSVMLDNLVVNNKSSGVHFSDFSSDNLVARNRIYDNNNTGISMQIGILSSNVVDNNICQNNYGIEVNAFSNAVIYNEITNNLNTGINILESFNIVNSNHINKNGEDGINIEGNQNSIIENIVVDNGVLDIDDNGIDNSFALNKCNISNPSAIC